MFIVLLSSTISMPLHAWEFNHPPLGISPFWLLPFGLITLLITYLLFINRRLQRSQQELIMSEQRLKRTVEGSGDTLWDWDIASGEIVRINDKYMVCKDQPDDKNICKLVHYKLNYFQLKSDDVIRSCVFFTDQKLKFSIWGGVFGL